MFLRAGCIAHSKRQLRKLGVCRLTVRWRPKQGHIRRSTTLVLFAAEQHKHLQHLPWHKIERHAASRHKQHGEEIARGKSQQGKCNLRRKLRPALRQDCCIRSQTLT